MEIKSILREIALEDVSVLEYSSGDLDTIVQQKIRVLDIGFKRRAMERVVSQYYYNHFNKLIMEEEVENVLPLFTKIKEDINGKEDNTNYIFVNVNPAPNVELLNFQKIIEKALKKKWIKDFVYVLEQRGESEEEMGKGFHTHIILEKDNVKSYSQAVKELGRTFNIVCDSSNFHLFSCQKIKQIDIEKRRNYILGRKADVNKHKKQDIDIIWRRDFGLKSYYGNMNICLKDPL